MSPSITETMAAAFDSFTARDLDEGIARKAALCLEDFLASALTAQSLPWVVQARRAALADGAGNTTLIGSAETATTSGAAFANAVAGHGLVRDDMHLGSVSHLGVVVLPTLLALAESTRLSGSRLLKSIAVGYEAGGKLGRTLMDVDIARIHRPTGTVGPFAAAAAAASALALDTESTAMALGFAANAAAGYNEWAAAGGTEMFFHPGFAVRSALTAAALAQNGATSSTSALEGEAGLLAAFGKHGQSLGMPFGNQPEIAETFFKEVPACNYAQTAAQAARDLVAAREVAIDDIVAVIVRVPRAAALYPGCDRASPIETILEAKMSIQYNVAAALLYGHFDEANFVPERQPACRRLAARITLEVDPELTARYPQHQGAEVTVESLNGAHETLALADVAPARDEIVHQRFLSAAQARLGEEKASRLAAGIESITSLDDVASLVALCRT